MLTLLILISIYIAITAGRSNAVICLLAWVLHSSTNYLIEIGGAGFSGVRLMLLALLCRIVIKKEHKGIVFRYYDVIVFVGHLWILVASLSKADVASNLTYRVGFIINSLGAYWVFRCLANTPETLHNVFKRIPYLLLPLALEMLYEQFTGHNLYSLLGGVPDEPAFRGGRIRSNGPFTHAILAGTVAAMLFPISYYLWGRKRLLAIVLSLSCIACIICSASSGPVASLFAVVVGGFMFHYRISIHKVLLGLVVMCGLLALVMKAPIWFLLARVDFTGNSTGWHRAALIDASIKHIDAWYLFGTEETKSWLPSGVNPDQNQTDITNHYLFYGVHSGIISLLSILCVVILSLLRVSKALAGMRRLDKRLLVALGASSFSVAITCISIAYFDNSGIIFWMVISASLASADYYLTKIKQGIPYIGNARGPLINA